MKKIIALFLAFISVTAFACGIKEREMVFVDVYDKETDVYYMTNYRRGVSTYHDVQNEPKVEFTLQEGDAGQVTATIVFEKSGVKKTTHLAGRVYGLTKCWGTSGYVRWVNGDVIPEGYFFGILVPYTQKILGK